MKTIQTHHIDTSQLEAQLTKIFGTLPKKPSLKRIQELVESDCLPVNLLTILETVRQCPEVANLDLLEEELPSPFFRKKSDNELDYYIPVTARQLANKHREVSKFLARYYFPALTATIEAVIQLLELDETRISHLVMMDQSTYGRWQDYCSIYDWYLEEEYIPDFVPNPLTPNWYRALYIFQSHPHLFKSSVDKYDIYKKAVYEIYLCTHSFPVEFIQALGIHWEPKPADRDAEVKELEEWLSWSQQHELIMNDMVEAQI